ncbi:MAG TPA: hypothetical protein VK943_02080 [Arenibaculum sp.]|nr:hypothetical protein [Arenibaculum sp.]
MAEARRNAFEIYLWRNPDANRVEAAATVGGMLLVAAMMPDRIAFRGEAT